MLQEPLLEVHNIQGNILAGFNKDYQILVGLVITDVPDNKRWLALLKDHIATVSEVLHFNRLFKALKNKRGQDPKTLCAAWLNIAFSHPGISKLMSAAQADLLPDPAFNSRRPFVYAVPFSCLEMEGRCARFRTRHIIDCRWRYA